MPKVVSSDQAESAANRMKSIIGGGLTGQINELKAQGQTLSDPNNWDGALARQFRDSTWPDVSKKLKQMVTDLEDLRNTVEQIVRNIAEAGGGR
jgi:uncharacterized protein YukE